MVGNDAAHNVNIVVSREDAADAVSLAEAMADKVYTFRGRYDRFLARRKSTGGTHTALDVIARWRIHHRGVLIATHARRHDPTKQSAEITRGVRGKEPQQRPTATVGVGSVIGVYCLYNLTYALASYPAGVVSDKIPRRMVVGCGLLIFAFAYIGLGVISTSTWVWVLFPGYGLYAALTDGVTKAWIVDLAPADARGRAIGVQGAVAGVGAIVAGIWAGLAWSGTGRVAQHQSRGSCDDGSVDRVEVPLCAWRTRQASDSEVLPAESALKRHGSEE